jgi:hypothetical protein
MYSSLYLVIGIFADARLSDGVLDDVVRSGIGAPVETGVAAHLLLIV